MANVLEDLLKEIEGANYTANIVLEDVNPKNRPGFEMQKRIAADRLVELRRQYKNALNEHVFKLFLKGEPSKCLTFADTARHEGEAIIVDSQQIYTNLTNEILPSMGKSGEFTSNQVVLLMQGIAQLCVKLNIIGYDSIKHLRNYYAPTFEETRRTVKELVQQSLGNDLNKLYIENDVTTRAIEERYTNAVVPLAIVGATDEEIESFKVSLFNSNSMVVNVDEVGTSKDAVIKTFLAVKKVLKAAKN